nr:MAG TPA: hypothetical protein [Caudoviricetes sp.]
MVITVRHKSGDSSHIPQYCFYVALIIVIFSYFSRVITLSHFFK